MEEALEKRRRKECRRREVVRSVKNHAFSAFKLHLGVYWDTVIPEQNGVAY